MYSILITSAECDGMGELYTSHTLNRVFSQTYRPLQVVVSDHSKDDLIENTIKTLNIPDDIDFVYTRYQEHYGSSSANWNNALKFAKGEYINFLAMDDYLLNTESVSNVVTHMSKHPSYKWCVSAFNMIDFNNNIEQYIPRWNANILFCNTLGGLSGLTIRKELTNVQFELGLNITFDVDFYHRLFMFAGVPLLFLTPTWVNKNNPYKVNRSSEYILLEDLNTLITKYSNASALRAHYLVKCATVSDIVEHLPVLYQYGLECKHITECGVRNIVSSYAFALGLLNKQDNSLRMIDIYLSEDYPYFKDICDKEGVNSIFCHESDLTCSLEQTDLLFIDTWHIYGQLKRELSRWNSYVNKYIILHDTTVDGVHGEVIRNNPDANIEQYIQDTGFSREELITGLWPAVEEFLQSHPEWRLKERLMNNNGLTILERVAISCLM